MRAWIFAYANLLGSFVGYVRTRGIEKAMGRDNLDYFALPTARTRLPRTLSATQSRMRKEFKRGTPSSFCPFRTFRTSEKYMVLFCYFSDRRKVHGAFLLLFGQAKSTLH